MQNEDKITATPIALDTLKVGDRFLDSDGCLCIYLGYAKESRVIEDQGSMKVAGEHYAVVSREFKPQRQYMWFYKNTWHQSELPSDFVAYPIGSATEVLVENMSAGYVFKWDFDCASDLKSDA